jgi:hypothetical protein
VDRDRFQSIPNPAVNARKTLEHHVRHEQPPDGRISPATGAAPAAGLLVGGVIGEAGARLDAVGESQRDRAPSASAAPTAARRRAGGREAEGHKAAASSIAR